MPLILEIVPFSLDMLRPIVFAFVIIALSALFNKIFQIVARRFAERGGGMTFLQFQALGSTAIWIIGAIFTLAVLGLPAEAIYLVVGLGILALVLASRDILSNWLAGYVVTAYRLFKLGDWIIVGKRYGRVAQINPLDTTIVTPRKERMIVPNSFFVKRAIINLTTPEGIHVSIPFKVDRKLPLEKVQQSILKAMEEMKSQLFPGTEPEIIVTKLDTKSVIMKLILLIGNPARLEATRSDAINKIKENLDGFEEKAFAP